MSALTDKIAHDLRRARAQLARGDTPARVMDVLAMQIAGQIGRTDVRFDMAAFADASGVPSPGPPQHMVRGEPIP